jgi:hypothetical protein
MKPPEISFSQGLYSETSQQSINQHAQTNTRACLDTLSLHGEHTHLQAKKSAGKGQPSASMLSNNL